MRRRLSARLLILDEAGRVLLFRFVYKRGPLAGQDFWGRRAAASRMARRWSRRPCASWSRKPACDGESVGSEVARREVALQLPDGEHVVQDERYFVVRVTDNALSRDAWTDLEREVMVEHRWWSLEELSRTEATVWPENLREMIETAQR